jgi:hypothetical protein
MSIIIISTDCVLCCVQSIDRTAEALLSIPEAVSMATAGMVGTQIITTFYERSRNVPKMFLECSLKVPGMFPECPLNGVFPECVP